MKMHDRVVLVPGASRSVGRAIARKFAESGAQLVLPLYSDWPDSIEEMRDEFSQAGYRFYCHPCDLTSDRETARFIDTIAEVHGKLHIVINNIERGGMPVVHGSYGLNHNLGQWELEFNTTVKAKWNLYQHCLPLMKKSGSGALINISSIAGITGRSGPASLLFSDGYCAANRSVSSFTETWAKEAAPEVRVNEIVLGLIQGRHAEGTRGWSTLSVQQRQDLLDHTLLERSGTPSEVAEVVYFLAVNAHFITGGRIRVDGGYCLGADRVIPPPPGILGRQDSE